MPTTKPSIISVTLQRDGISSPWGFRLSGGCDLDHPLTITRISYGSPSDGHLQAGDIIKKIGNYDARDLRHTDALDLFKNCGSCITIVVEREVPIQQNGCPSRNTLPFIPQSPIAGGVATPFTVAGLPAYEKAQQKVHNNLCRFPPVLLDSPHNGRSATASPHKFELEPEMHSAGEQPYRTNPLVLPGAKVSKDPAPTMSYLRHHPNPMMRSRPAEYEWVPADIAKKQQLADTMLERALGDDLRSGKKVVPKQFNTPIGLYSEQNIANSVQAHTGGFTPLRKTVHYDPSKSETFRALQEQEFGNHVQEVNIPVTRVFSPVKSTKLAPPTTYNPNRASPQPHPTAPHPKVDYGVSPEEIHQSNSFKRLMNMVMTEY